MAHGINPNPSVSSISLSSTSNVKKLMRRYSKKKLALAGAMIIITLIVTAIFSPLISPYDPVYDQNYDLILSGPTSQHLLGTDDLGRDTFSRLVWGARLSIQAALISVGLAVAIGVPIGLLAGYVGGVWDEWVIMRFVDALQAFPSLILAMAMAAVLGGGFYNAMVAIGIGFLPSFIRITRAKVLMIKNLEYVQAAKASGATNLRIMFLHILPNTMPPLLVQITLSMATAILAEAGLSYLGLGASPEQASWGSMLNVAQGYLNVQPLLAIWPGIAIFLSVLGFNLFGDGIRDILDPRLKQ